MHMCALDTRPEKPIGYLHAPKGERGYRIVGECCKARFAAVYSAVYRVNLAPYRATCFGCGAVLFEGGSRVELFDGT